MSNLKHWIWLSQRKGVEGQAAVKVLEYFGTPEQVHAADRGAFELMGGLNERAIRSLMDKSLDEADRILGDCDRLGIRLLTLQDSTLPGTAGGHPPAAHGALLEGQADCI